MKTRRFIHPTKNSFFEVCWDAFRAEAVAGAIGTRGRARDVAVSAIEGEIEKRLAQGFVEVVPDVLPEEAKAAPTAKPAPEILAEIVAHPDDDGPRLVYADYLTSQGDPLGELIVLQCERARLDRWDPQHKLLADREEQLLLVYRKRWTSGLDDDVRVVFRRGFIDRIRIERTSSTTAGMLDRVFDRAIASMLRTLEMPGDFAVARVGSPASLARLTGLHVRGPFVYGSSLGPVLANPALANLERLGLRGTNLGRLDVKQIPKRAWRELDLHQNTLGVNGTKAAIECLDVSMIEALDLGASGVSDDGVGKLVEHSFERLHTLELASSNISQRAIGMLAKATGFRAIRRLDLASNSIGGDGFVAFLASDHWPALVDLDLGGTRLTDTDAGLLAASPLAARLVSLDLGHTQITPAGALSLAAVAWPALRHLNLAGCGVSREVAQTLRARLPHVRMAVRA